MRQLPHNEPRVLFPPLLLGDVTEDDRCGDKAPEAVEHGRRADRDGNVRAVLPPADAFGRHTLTCLDAVEYCCLAPAIRTFGYEQIMIAPDRLSRGISEHPFGARIPAAYAAIDRPANDGIRGGFDDRSQMRLIELGAPLLRYLVADHAYADHRSAR